MGHATSIFRSQFRLKTIPVQSSLSQENFQMITPNKRRRIPTFTKLPYDMYGEIFSYFNSKDDVLSFILINEEINEWSRLHVSARASSRIVYALMTADQYHHQTRLRKYPYITSLRFREISSTCFGHLRAFPNIVHLIMVKCRFNDEINGEVTCCGFPLDEPIKSVKTLTLRKCSLIGIRFSLFPNLVQLSVDQCHHFSQIPSIPSLISLTIHKCKWLQDIGLMKSLTTLKLVGMTCLTGKHLQNVPELKKFECRWYASEILSGLHWCKHLEDVTLGPNCRLLENARMTKIHIKSFRCYTTNETIEYVKDMINLEVLKFFVVINPDRVIKCKYEHIREMKHLRTLHINGHWFGGDILDNKPHLQELSISDNDNVTISDLRKLKALKKLELICCMNVTKKEVEGLLGIKSLTYMGYE